jgi:kumamolisin
MAFALIGLAALLVAGCSLPTTAGSTTGALSGACASSQASVQPSGALSTPLAGVTPTGAVPDGQQIHLNIALSLNQAQLDACVASIYDPSSPNYQHYLSPQDIAAKFAPSAAQIQSLTSYLTSNGLTVSQTYATNASLSVDGPVSAINKAFNITLDQYQVGGRQVYAPNQAPSLPSNIQDFISNIIGLTDVSSVHCNINGVPNESCGLIDHYSSFAMPTSQQLAAAKASQQPKAGNIGDCTLDRFGVPGLGGGSSGGSGLPTLLTWDDLSNSYGLTALKAAGFDGGTSTIGVVEFDTYQRSDVVNYMICAGKYAQDRLVNEAIDTKSTDAAPDSGPGAGEAELDLELIAGLTSKNTKIIDYYSPNNDQWESELLDILNKVASEKKVSVLSISYGDFEADMTPAYMESINNAMKVLAAEGISVLVASGDCGAYASGQYGVRAVSFPASAPWAIAVGGTSLTTDPLAQNRQSETVWTNTSPDKTSCQNTWGSGGGVSAVPSFTIPSWQKGTGVSNQYSTGSRQIPDVSAAAINISFYYSGLWLGVGGTSAAAPIWAAGIDVVNQALAAAHKPNFGGVPTIYTLANGSSASKIYNDITQGGGLQTTPTFQATTGWSYVTGWGTPNFDQIVSALGGA